MSKTLEAPKQTQSKKYVSRIRPTLCRRCGKPALAPPSWMKIFSMIDGRRGGRGYFSTSEVRQGLKISPAMTQNILLQAMSDGVLEKMFPDSKAGMYRRTTAGLAAFYAWKKAEGGK